MALIRRYRAADSIGRLQIRWYAAAGVALSVGFLAFITGAITLEPDSAVGELALILLLVTAVVPPIALVFAISRYRLYDIDSILERAFVYGGLTAILAGLYTASIRLFNSLFAALTGEASDIALVATTLVLATTFFPIKRRLEAILEQRFPTKGSEREVPTSPAPTSLLDDPRFAAALDARIRAIVAERSSTMRE